MKRIILLLTLLCVYSECLYSDEKKNLTELFSLASLNSVNLKTGEWVEQCSDYESQGPHPLSIKRILYDIGRHPDELSPEWQWTLPQLNTSGLPLFEMEGYQFTYDQHKQLVSAQNKFGQLVTVKRPDELNLILHLPGQKKIHYQFEKIDKVKRLKKVVRPGYPDITYTYEKIGKTKKVVLKKKDLGDGRYTEWRYDEMGRVAALLAPASNDSSPVVVSTFVYYPDYTEVIDALHAKRVYRFNAFSEVSSIEHIMDGKTVKKETFLWDRGQLKEQSIFDGQGKLLLSNQKKFDNDLRVIEEKWVGDLTGLGNQDTFTTTYTYDEKGHLIKQVEGDRVIEFKWDQDLVKEKIEGLIVTRFRYDSRNLPIEETVTDGLTTLTTLTGPYNTLGEPLSIKKFRNNFLIEDQSFTYSSEGWLLSEVLYKEGKLVKSEVYERDSAGRILSKTDHEGHIEKFIYDKHGNILEHFSIQSKKPLTMNYDFMNRLISTDGQNSFTYDAYGNTLTKTDECGNTTYFMYDALGRLIETIEPPILTPEGFISARTVYTYDAMNRVLSKTDPMGYTTYYQYTARGETKRIDHPDQTFETFEYYPNGKLKKALTRNQKTLEYEYDSLGRLISTSEKTASRLVSKKITSYSLDKIASETSLDYTTKPVFHPDGKLEKVWVSGPQDTFEIKNLEYPTPEEKGEAPSFPFESHPIVNELNQTVIETTLTLQSGVKVIKTYNARGMLESTRKVGLMGEILSHKKTLYNLNGDVVQENSSDQTIIYKKGVMGRLEEMIEGYGSSKQRKTVFRYDHLGNHVELIKPDGVSLYFKYDGDEIVQLTSSDLTIHYVYIYDGSRLVEALDRNTGLSTKRSYNSLGQITTEIQSNRLKTEKIYDSQGNLIRLMLPDGSAIQYSYTNGKLQSVQRLDADLRVLATHTLDGMTETMIHDLGSITTFRDDEGRITKIASPFREEEYLYEKQLKEIKVDGNRVHSYDYDSLNRLALDNEHRYQYDENDNLTLIDSEHFHYNALNEIDNSGYLYDLNGNLIETPTTKLGYDALNRLVFAETSEGMVLYNYDPFSRRMHRGDIAYIWEGREEIGSYRNGIEDLKILAGSQTAFVEINHELLAVQKDFKGSIAIYIDSSGQKREDGPWGLQAKRVDPLTGFIHFGDRDFDPVSRRFINTDPKGFVDGLNLYTFAKNNPNSYTDYYGHTSILDSFSSALHLGMNVLKAFYSGIQSYRDWVNNFTGLTTVYHYLEQASFKLLGKSFLAYCGIYPESAQSGVFGEGEIDPKVRISFAHGILNVRSDLVDNLRQLSISHGGVNIHYVYRPTEGFAWDILKCMAIKFGWVSPEAKEIVRMWKGLIEEMGGVEGGGKIIHYAHSLGGTDTYTALSFMTADEQKMIDIRTIGSATLIPEEGYYTATNYVSVRDGVCFFDPVRYFKARFKGKGNTVFVGYFWTLGIPFSDHPMSVDSYQEVIKALGQAFIETYAH